MIRDIQGWELNKPVVCNEDSQAIGQLEVAFKTHTSWGYYNNMTKQEPPAAWGITSGEDRFFAHRMAAGIGIELPSIPPEEQYYLQGLESHMTTNGERWIRLASLYPETIDHVDFYRNGSLFYAAYDEPFTVHFITNWRQGGVKTQPDDQWLARIHLHDGSIVEKTDTQALSYQPEGAAGPFKEISFWNISYRRTYRSWGAHPRFGASRDFPIPETTISLGW